MERSRQQFTELTALIDTLRVKVEDSIPVEKETDGLTSMWFNSMEFDLDLLDSAAVERRERDVSLLNRLRSTMKKVRSVDTLNMSGNHVLVHFKEGHDLDVVLKADTSTYTIDSASVRER